jgi:hypothetical protein
LSGAPLIEENVPENYTAIPPILLLGTAALFPLILLLGLLLLDQKYDSFLKFIGMGLIIYLGYLLILFFNFLTSESYILLSESGSVMNYNNPLLFYLPAIFIPIFIPILALEYRFRFSRATDTDKSMILYLILFLFSQICISLLLIFCYILFFDNSISDLFTMIIDLTFALSLPAWSLGVVLSLIQIVFTSFICWKWINRNLPGPSLFHWVSAYFSYVFLYGGILLLLFLTSPSQMQQLITAEDITSIFILLGGFLLLPSLSFILSATKIVAVLIFFLFPEVTGDSAFMLAFLFFGLFLISLIFFFPFVPLFLFNAEITFIKRFRSKKVTEKYQITY